MRHQEYTNLVKLMKKDNFSLNELYSLFHVETLMDVAEEITEYINGNVEENYRNEFFKTYHFFLYTLTENITLEEDVYSLRYLVDKSLKILKDKIKAYNKGEKTKDSFYYAICKLISSIKGNKEYADAIFVDKFSDEDVQIVWFVITKLNNPDYLYRLVDLHSHYVNLKDSYNQHIFVKMISHMVSNINEFSEEEIKNYKRMVVLFLESEDLKLSNDELYNILEYLEDTLTSININHKNDIKFIINEIERHYEVINTDSRVICIDEAKKKQKFNIIIPTIDDRVDLTNLLTFSIDSIRDNNPTKILIDDAISIEETIDGVNLYIHIPDVDNLIKRDTDMDEHMRSVGESIYVSGMKKPMIEYNVAKQCSLSHGNVRPALTFIIKLDNNGNVIDLDFIKSLINVNWNLSKGYAEYFYKSNFNPALKDALKIAKKYATILRKNRGETVGKIKTSSLIMEETNILLDIVVADYFKRNGLPFAYKNYLGKRSIRSAKDVSLCEQFNRENNISEEGRNIVYSVFDIYNRVYYDTVSIGNKSFGGKDVGNVGNPLREYISLESDRLIKDLLIDRLGNLDYWSERIERDAIEYTETSAKIRSLYGSSN